MGTTPLRTESSREGRSDCGAIVVIEAKANLRLELVWPFGSGALGTCTQWAALEKLALP